MQLYQKQNTFYQLLVAFFKFTLNLEYFEKKDYNHRSSIFEIMGSENVVRWMSKSPVSEEPSKGNMEDVRKHSRNLHNRVFIWLIDPCEVN